MRMGPEVIGGWYAKLSLPGRVLLFINLGAVGLAAFTAISSWVLLRWTGLLPMFPDPMDRFRQFWEYLPYYHANARVHQGIMLGVVAGLAPFGLIAMGIYNARKQARLSRPLYGETHSASAAEMQEGGLKLRRKL